MFGVKTFTVAGVDYITRLFSKAVFARVENNLTIRRLQKQLRLPTKQNKYQSTVS